MATPKQRVVSAIQEYIKTEEWQKLKNKNKQFSDALENAVAEDISFGAQPTFIIGYVWGKSTADGTSTFGNTETQRTISMTYTTNNKLFVASSNTATKKTLKEALKRFDYNTDKYYTYADVRYLAEEKGKSVCSEALWDVNIPMKNHYLRSYSFEADGDSFNCPLWPINLSVKSANGKSKEVEIGYWEEHNGKASIDLIIKPPLTTLKKFIIAGVMGVVLGVIIGLLLI